VLFRSVDQVGAGNKLRFARQLGKLHPLKTTPSINAILSRADPLIEPLDYLRHSGDFEAFLRAGFEATSLEMTGSPAARQVYHTVEDTLSIMEPEALSRTLDGIFQVIGILDQEDYTSSSVRL
jgi:hypothetical protein